MWERIVFFVPRLADRFVQDRKFIRWLLQREQEKLLTLTFREQKGQLVVSSVVDYLSFRHIVYDLFESRVTFYVSAKRRTDTLAATRLLLKEQGIPYEVKEMSLYLRPRQDADFQE